MILNKKEIEYLFIQLRADLMKFPNDPLLKQLLGKVKVAVDNNKE